MNREKGKLHEAKEILLSPRTDYQGKLRYLVPLFYILIAQLMFWIFYYVSIHVSRQMFLNFAFVMILVWLLWGFAIMRYRRQKERLAAEGKISSRMKSFCQEKKGVCCALLGLIGGFIAWNILYITEKWLPDEIWRIFVAVLFLASLSLLYVIVRKRAKESERNA